MEIQPQAHEPTVEEDAQQKMERLQIFILDIENAMRKNTEDDKLWLEALVDPNDSTFQSLVSLLVEPKYAGFVQLRCAVLRAVQMMLRIAASMAIEGGIHPAQANVGMLCFEELAGEEMAREACVVLRNMSASEEEIEASCNALLVLSELGPDVFEEALVLKLLDLFVSLPDRADELVEVALRFHAWAGRLRERLLVEMTSCSGGNILCEVLLQVVNRCLGARSLRGVKILAGCLQLDGSENLLYTNDVRVLVEVLERELPNHAGDAAAFVVYAECFKGLFRRYEVARAHRNAQIIQILKDLCDDQQISPVVNEKCSEILMIVSRTMDA